MAKYNVILVQTRWMHIEVDAESAAEVDMELLGRELCGPEWDSWADDEKEVTLDAVISIEHGAWGGSTGPWEMADVCLPDQAGLAS